MNWPKTVVANAVPRVVAPSIGAPRHGSHEVASVRVWSGGAANRGRRHCRRTPPDRPPGTERLGGSVPEAWQSAYASTSPRWAVPDPGKRCCRPAAIDEPALRQFVTRCSVRPEQQGCRNFIGTPPAPLDMLALRPAVRQCDAARPFCRWPPCRMAGFVWPVLRQIPCRQNPGF
jgi:hypothetical protein